MAENTRKKEKWLLFPPHVVEAIGGKFVLGSVVETKSDNTYMIAWNDTSLSNHSCIAPYDAVLRGISDYAKVYELVSRVTYFFTTFR